MKYLNEKHNYVKTVRRKLLLVIFLITISFTSYTREKLVFSAFKSIVTPVSTEILETAYDRIGYDVEFEIMPVKRSLFEANSGRSDGEVARSNEIEADFKNLIRINVPINWFELRLFSKKHDIYIDDIENFHDYTFGFMRGIDLYEHYLDGFKIVTADNAHLNFKRLDEGIIDFVLTTNVAGVARLDEGEYGDIKMLNPALRTINLYHYLNKKHEKIVPKIYKALKEMYNNGEIHKIIEKHYKIPAIEKAD